MFVWFLRTAISRKLYDKPNCIEELAEMREWMKSIPEKLKEHQEVIDKATQDYDLIEEFFYNLSLDEFNTKLVLHQKVFC